MYQKITQLLPLTCLCLGGALLSRPAVARDVATVDGLTITQDDVRRSADILGARAAPTLANPQLKRQLLDHMIDTALLANAGAAAKLTKTPAFEEQLAQARAQILANMYVAQYVAEHTGDAALKSFFAQDPARFSTKEIHAQHILVPDAQTARRVLSSAQGQGSDFLPLIQKFKTDGASGGDLGFFRRGRMLPEFDAVAFALKPGAIYPSAVRTAFGYHIIKVVEVRGNDQVNYDDVRPEVLAALDHEVREHLLKSLRDGAKITLYDDALRDVRAAH